MAYLNNLLIQTNMVFAKKRSGESQIIHFVHDISDTLNESDQTNILVMDFNKTFDKVEKGSIVFAKIMLLLPGLDPFFQTELNEMCLKARSLIPALSCLVCPRVLCWDPVCLFCM